MIDPVVLNECGIFFVQADRNIQSFCSLHRVIQESRIFKRDTVVCKTAGAGFFQRGHVCHFFAF